MFRPMPDRPMPVTLLPSVIYKEVGGHKLRMDIVQPQTEGVFPAVIVIFLGAYLSDAYGLGTSSDCCPLFASHGFVGISVQLRTSFKATYPAQLEDLQDAIRFLRDNADRYNLDPNRMGISGHSAGGHLAALAGLISVENNHLQAVAIGSSPADFLDFGGYFQDDAFPLTQLFGSKLSENKALARAASPINHVTENAPPFLIAHGTLDETIPYRHAEMLRDKLLAAGVEVEFVRLEDAYHNWSQELEPASGEGDEGKLNLMALAFFQKHLT